MGKKARLGTPRITLQPQSRSPTRTLQRFKSLWATAEWAEALNCYRTWTSQAGKKCDPRIESELLLRCASVAYRKGDFEKALARLGEAYPKDPQRARRYLVCKGICFAKKGRLKESIDLFADAGDDYHCGVLSYLAEGHKPLPKLEPIGIAFETKQLLSFWRGLSDPSVSEPSSPALRKLKNAYLALAQGEDPDTSLASLRDTPECKNLALYLQFLSAVHFRRNIRIRHLIVGDPSACREMSFLALLDSHLLLLLKEKEYREIETLRSMLEEHHIHPGQLERITDELLFATALNEIDAGRLEAALERLREIGQRTPSLVHNMALLYQKIGRLAEANENWIVLLKVDGKPRRSDPEERRLAYAAAAKHIASNYLMDDQPERAVPFFKEALSICEDDREALENLAVVSIELGGYQDALSYARRLYDLDPQNEQYLIGYLSSLLARGSFDTLLPLIEEHWERYARGSSARRVLADIAIYAAWQMRAAKPEKARWIVELVREIDADIPHLIYLEAYFFDKDGQRDQAEDRFARLIERTENHTDQALLGMALYGEGYRDHSISLFTRLINCGCEASAEAFEDIVGFLAQRSDHDATRRLCLFAIKSRKYSPYEVADILFTAGKPAWAREFSERVLDDPDSGEDECFLHLLILNDIGNPVETIAFAESVKSRMANSVDPDFPAMMDYVIKQLKSKGRVKMPYG